MMGKWKSRPLHSWFLCEDVKVKVMQYWSKPTCKWCHGQGDQSCRYAGGTTAKYCSENKTVKHYLLGTLSIFLVCSLHVCSFSVSMIFKTPQQTRTILINYFPNIYDHLHLSISRPGFIVGTGPGDITILRTTIREIRWDTITGDSAAKIILCPFYGLVNEWCLRKKLKEQK